MFYSISDRMYMVLENKNVDAVFEMGLESKYEMIIKYRANICFVGDDHLGEDEWINLEELLKGKCKIIYIPRTPNISSKELRKINEN